MEDACRLPHGVGSVLSVEIKPKFGAVSGWGLQSKVDNCNSVGISTAVISLRQYQVVNSLRTGLTNFVVTACIRDWNFPLGKSNLHHVFAQRIYSAVMSCPWITLLRRCSRIHRITWKYSWTGLSASTRTQNLLIYHSSEKVGCSETMKMPRLHWNEW